MSPPVWFITGASNGFGLLLCLRALKAGHKVIGTVRSKYRASEAVKSIEDAGGKVIEMDMTESQASLTRKIQDAEHQFYGGIDVLVNNAGFSILGPISSFRYVYPTLKPFPLSVQLSSPALPTAARSAVNFSSACKTF